MILKSAPVGGSTGHLVGRSLLEELYREQTGEELPEIVIAPGGKPGFSRGGWHFSISHTRHWAFCALSRRSVGLDAEELSRRVSPALAEKILSPGELAQYRAAGDKNRAMLTFWVLKEARAKLSGRGLSYPLECTDFSLDDPRVFLWNGCLVAVMEEDDAV